MKDVEEEFSRKYKECGPINSWAVKELILDEGYSYLSKFNY
jgi:hypothetical protein